jgi:hypothetical protein
MAAPQLKSVEWYQIVDGREIKVDFVVPNVQYKAVLTIYSDIQTTTLVEIRVDVINWLDAVIASKYVALKQGNNTVEIPFIFTHDVDSHTGENPYSNIRGIFVRIEGVYDVQSVENRFSSNAEVTVSDYYWVGRKMSVNGKEYYPNDYAPVRAGDVVKLYGYLYKDGNPVSNAKIRWRLPGGDKVDDYTDGRGYFEKNTTVPDYSPYLCGCKVEYAVVSVPSEEKGGLPLLIGPYRVKYMCDTPTTTTTTTVPTTTTTVPTNVFFDVLDIYTVPSKPKIMEEVLIYAKIKNTGSAYGTGSVKLYINGVRHPLVNYIGLASGYAFSVPWKYTFYKPGYYELKVDTGYDTMTKTIYVSDVITTTTPTTTITPYKPIPGFDAVFAIAGMIALAYLLRKK